MQNILDLDRYPIDREGSPEWTRLVEACAAALADNGMDLVVDVGGPSGTWPTTPSIPGRSLIDIWHVLASHTAHPILRPRGGDQPARPGFGAGSPHRCS